MLTRYTLFLSLVFSVLFFVASAGYAQTVNVNTATKAELQTIKGIGEKTAERIIEERERAGDFESVEDFALRVKGLGQKRAAKMMESGLIIGNEQASNQSKPSSAISAPTISSVVAKEVKAVKKRLKGAAPSAVAELYFVKPK
ncbi:hypothetical protein AAEX37_01680 [Oligella sp. MSHR50489EDL]|uniref:ComEA family DNA-binding protein n=1 Tax=Oligella sp. MSHR50489EDL TaxID=3139409 RepID=UPI003D81A473